VVRLEFNARVELRLVRVGLTGSDGRAVPLGEPSLANDARTIVVVAPQAAFGPGRYVVRWQVAGADGHPTSGSFAFTVVKGAEMRAGADSAARGDSTMVSVDPIIRTAFSEQSFLYVVVRWVQYIAAFLVLGGFVFSALVVDRVRDSAGSAREYLASVRATALRVARWAATLLIVVQGARLLAQRATLRDASDVSFDVSAADVVLGTFWGTGWLLVLGGALLAMLAIVRAERAGGARQRAAGNPVPLDDAEALVTDDDAFRAPASSAVGVETLEAPPRILAKVRIDASPGAGNLPWFAGSALVIAVGLALSGHQAASPIGLAGVAVDAIHVLGTAGWIGTLGTLVLAGLLGPRNYSTSHDGVAALLRAFSPVVLMSAAVGGGAGLVLAYVNVGSFAALWAGAYGRVLLLKLAALSMVAGTGAYNWRRVVPVLGSEGATRALRRSASAEAVIALVVIAITSVLVATPLLEMP